MLNLHFKNNDNKHVLIEKNGFISTGLELICFGKSINTCKEQNIESDNEFGFDILIIYSEESYMSRKFNIHTETIFNCTQIHYGYTEMGSIEPLTKIAFESDIHQSGFNREIKNIERVYVKFSNRKYDNFHL